MEDARAVRTPARSRLKQSARGCLASTKATIPARHLAFSDLVGN